MDKNKKTYNLETFSSSFRYPLIYCVNCYVLFHFYLIIQKNALKKVLDISESYGIFVNVYFDIKTILFKNNMKSK